MRSRSLGDSFAHALEGLRYSLDTQRNARVHLAVGAVTLLGSVALGLSALELAIVVLAIAVVFFAELLNTVVETVVDLNTNEIHPLAKIAKDVAAGAVLWTAVGSVAIGLLVIGPHVVALFR
ncbi:MAG: diacylglycerol kinase family protein [Chloroflexi bacterium]|nr:diacylglycerol kinase family protein [Chloroflexota bacterium]